MLFTEKSAFFPPFCFVFSGFFLQIVRVNNKKKVQVKQIFFRCPGFFSLE